MEFRPGTCSSCKANFRIPASFTAHRAKCSKCGGTVEIGPVTNDGAGSTPGTAKAVSAPIAGAAARLAQAPESAEAHVPAAQPVPARPVPASVPAKPAAKLAGAAMANATAPTKSMQRGSAQAAAARREAEEAEHAETMERSRRRARVKSKDGNPVMIVVALGVCLVISLIAMTVYKSNVRKKKDEDARIAAAAIERGIQDKKLAAAQLAVREAEMRKPAKEAETPAGADPSVKQPKPAPKPAQPAPEKAVEGYDLSKIPDFGPGPGTTPAQWTEVQKLAAQLVDFSHGVQATKAGYALEDLPKEGFPAILNQLKKLKLDDEKGYANADLTRRLLQRICPNGNIKWRSRDEKDWLKYNQTAIKKWCDLWTAASSDDAYWAKVTKDWSKAATEKPALKPDEK